MLMGQPVFAWLVAGVVSVAERVGSAGGRVGW